MAHDVRDNTKLTAQPSIGLKPQTFKYDIIQMCLYSGMANVPPPQLKCHPELHSAPITFHFFRLFHYIVVTCYSPPPPPRNYANWAFFDKTKTRFA